MEVKTEEESSSSRPAAGSLSRSGSGAEVESMLTVCFGKVGAATGRFPGCSLCLVLAACWALASGMVVRDKIVNVDLFESLLLRPGTRLQRESDWVGKYEDVGYSSGSEATNGRATRGGKNVLSRKNLLQLVGFYRDARVHEIAIEHRGVRYDTSRVLTFSGVNQPYRFSVLDCFQEGVYDYEGDVTILGSSATLVLGVVDEVLGPFLAADQTGVRLTPYNYCLYLRAAVLYAPSTSFDAHTFGRCRQFVEEDPGPEYEPLSAFYDFHRFMAFDYVSAAPSTYKPWACRVTLSDETHCDPILGCCELSTAYAACASCVHFDACDDYQFAWDDSSANATDSQLRALLPETVTTENCETLQELLGIDSWLPNAHYDRDYAAQSSCDAFDFYPLSTLYSLSVGADGLQLPTSLDLSDCAERQALFDSTDAGEQRNLTEFAVTELYCKMLGDSSTCSTSLEGDDFDWRFKAVNVGNEEQLAATAVSGECAHWDGGPAGSVKLFEYVPLQVILGDVSRSNGVFSTNAAQSVQVSNGYKDIRDTLRSENINVSTKDARQGRELYLIKYAKVFHGRHHGGSMIYGSYSSGGGGAAQRSSSDQAVPETYLVILAYALILVYTLGIVTISGDPTKPRRALLDAALALVSVICVFSGLVAGMGFALYCGLKFTPVAVQVLPFLVLGLGINDCYVLTHRHLEILELLGNNPPLGGGAAQAECITAEAGASVTITTFANVVVFFVAAQVVKMRMIADFSFMAACSLTGTYLAIMLGYSGAISIHTSLVFRNSKEPPIPLESAHISSPRPCPHPVGSAASSSAQDMKTSSRRARAHAYANTIAGRPRVAACIVLVIVAAVAVVVGIGIQLVELNYAVNYIFARRSSEDIFWRTKLKYLNSNFFDIHTGQSDFAYKHPLLATTDELEGEDRYSLMQQVMSAKKVIKRGQVSWYNTFISWNMPCGSWSFESGSSLSDADVETKCEDSDWYRPMGGVYNSRCSSDDALTEPGGACGPVVSEKYLNESEFSRAARKAMIYSDGDSDLSTPLIPACTAWPVQYFVCDGSPCFDARALTQDLYEQVVNNQTVVYGVHPHHFYDCINLFFRHDSKHDLQSPLFNCEDPANPRKRRMCVSVNKEQRSVWRGKNGDRDMGFSQTIVWGTGLKTGRNWLKMIRSLRRKLNSFESRTDIQAYPHGTFWTFYYQFAFIERVFVEAFGYSALAVFLLVFLFFILGQPSGTPMMTRVAEAGRLALLVIVGVAIQIVLFVALMGLTNLWLNCFTLATVIVSFGIAIEGVAHTSFGYLSAHGTSHERATKAIDRYFMPITDGAFTTFLGFAPIAGSKYLYVVLYYFAIYVMLILVAYVVGVVLFPALLATFGRKSDYQPSRKPTFSQIGNDEKDMAIPPQVVHADDEAQEKEEPPLVVPGKSAFEISVDL
mmetsp:Transcript_14823/g.46626  ORF Transcript_14823/g.46626 Transcript_14823/m.46626 type:complete len:1421 (-) Transcript_14823:400-4662(-)